ncbi:MULTISPECIES: MgtC/SapB family protein [unclassified Saccharibacter]|uniref:MgtC/SapB family protein n=1 Tax=unclassified Saccharibacter TaxID=2648722 RepID=UPI001328F1D6|nr:MULTISPECIES: MgtC/SapB family protein [unclassified Saccharibacter]MXV36268.1 MgtC/SapB family protein [Saccharibacter sp. EH611]MXV57128.1 MgtC/SapB family protein [Saccharibacter sp. EH70]MXV66512.1 MgtC/SapB family protein [Saccharibacter sp. EH60]
MHFTHTFDPQSFLDTFGSYFSAFTFGALIGVERQLRQRTAGLRTHALVALGASAFVDLAQHLGDANSAIRVISYVVSGVGFLGAGVIMKDGGTISGLNTAATLWCSAAIGACAGSDMIAEAALLTVFILLANTLLRYVVRWVNKHAPAASANAQDESE